MDAATRRRRYPLFVQELDGPTFASLDELAEWEWNNADVENEFDVDTAYERHLEINDQYRWEVEEDERRASCFAW